MCLLYVKGINLWFETMKELGLKIIRWEVITDKSIDLSS